MAAGNDRGAVADEAGRDVVDSVGKLFPFTGDKCLGLAHLKDGRGSGDETPVQHLYFDSDDMFISAYCCR
jgi:hypothetical protein